MASEQFQTEADVRSAQCDVLIIGGSLGGVAAAIRAGEMGARVILVEATDWIGGQLTAQGVCTPDENAWIESGGGTASYRAFRERVREHYRSRYRMSDAGAGQQHLNPGSCWVSRLSVEPLVAARMLTAALRATPGMDLRLGTRAVAAETDDGRITGVTVEGPTGVRERLEAAMVLDATELGDLLPLAGVEHVIGAEARAETGEPDAPDQPHRGWLQPFTFPFALELRPVGEDHTIAPPPDYGELRALQRYHILDGAMRGMFGDMGWWTYRRVIAAQNFDDPAFPCDVAMVNTVSNDYQGAVVPSSSPGDDAAALAAGRRASLGYIFWLQTECPRVDDPSGRGYPEMRLRADWFGTPDGIAPAPYIRESRRIRALKTVLEQEIVALDSGGAPCQPGPRAAHYADSCGIGHYWLDIHEGPAGEPSRLLETRPFQIPLGALIPVRMANLLAACKDLGVTHLTNGAYRLHPIEWNVGEAAGALAAWCAARVLMPRSVWSDSARLLEFQEALVSAGVPLYWWADLPSEHPAFAAAQCLAMRGIWPGGDTLGFRPDDPLDEAQARQIAGALPPGLEAPCPGTARGEAARDLFRRLERR